MNGKRINWGILAPGNIARKFASDLKLVPGSILKGVGSRHIERSKAFAEEFGAGQAFGSYEELAKSPDIDVVYIASPHTSHFEHTMLCLEHGKHVLCEKPLAMNSHQVELMHKKAKEKNLFLMEAFWTRFIPSYQKFRQLALDGTIGEIKLIQADFGFNLPFEPNHRLWNKELGGGSLLDIGIYPVFLALDIAGVPDEIKAKAFFSQTKIDESCAVIFSYESGKKIASLSSSIVSHTPIEAIISGTNGRIKLKRMWHIPSSIEIETETEKQTIKFEEKGFGYEYEISEVNKCLLEGKTESELFPLEFSHKLHQTLDKIRRQIGLEY